MICRYYLKLDDDIVWVADGAIEAMLEEKLRGRFLYVSANVINHSSFALVCSYNLTNRSIIIVKYMTSLQKCTKTIIIVNTILMFVFQDSKHNSHLFCRCMHGWESWTATSRVCREHAGRS